MSPPVVGTLGHRRPHRVEVDVHRAGQQSRLIDDPLCLKTSFPEAAGALVLLVRHPCDRLGKRPHQPRDIRKPRANLGKLFLVPHQRLDIIFGRIGEVFLDPA